MNRFLKHASAGYVVIIIISVMIFALVQVRFGTILIWTGFAAIIVGGMAAMGAESVEGEYNLKLDQKIQQMNYARSTAKWMEMNKSFNFCLVMGVTGGLCIISGLAINYFFTGAF